MAVTESARMPNFLSVPGPSFLKEKKIEHSPPASPTPKEVGLRTLDSSDSAPVQPDSTVTAAEQAVCEMGIPADVVQLAKAFLQERGADFANAIELFTAAEEFRNCEAKQTAVEPTPSLPDKAELKARVRRLAQENHKLYQRKMCRACKVVDLASSGVTFLPCGHFVMCEVCSEKYDDCPACGKSIMGTVRTFLS